MSFISSAVSSCVMPAEGSSSSSSLGSADQRAADFDTAPIDHREAGNRLEQTIGERGLEHSTNVRAAAIVFLELALEVAAPDQIEPQALIEPLWLPIMTLSKIESGRRQARALERARHAGADRSPARLAVIVGAIEDDAAGVGADRCR